jgi:hypothetical protein
LPPAATNHRIANAIFGINIQTKSKQVLEHWNAAAVRDVVRRWRMARGVVKRRCF